MIQFLFYAIFDLDSTKSYAWKKKSPLNKTTSNSIGLCQRVLIILNQVLFIVGHGDGANRGRFKSPRVPWQYYQHQ
jgi:hypothetical protein